MAKVSAKKKRKADETFDEEEDESSDSDESESESESNEGNSEEENNNNMSEDEEGEGETAKLTPANKGGDKTPGSSPGMKMRSGRKKKRSKTSDSAAAAAGSGTSDVGASTTKRGTTPHNKRAKKNDGTATAAAAATKQNGKKKKAAKKKTPHPKKKGAVGLMDMEEEEDDDENNMSGEQSSDDDEDMANDDEKRSDDNINNNEKSSKKGKRRKSVGFVINNDGNGNDATVLKVPPETTREAVAAAQLTQEDDDEVANDETPVAESTNETTGGGMAGGLLRLVSQTLRLPSQHTPKPPTQLHHQNGGVDSVSPAPPPGGGRRLIFATTAKKPTSKDGDATAKTGRNKLLMQTRQKQQTSSTTASATSSEQRGRAATATIAESTVEESNDTAVGTLSYISQLKEDLQQNSEQYKKVIVLYTKGWLTLLLVVFLISNVANTTSMGIMWNVRSQSTMLSNLYGIKPANNATVTAISSSESKIDNDSPVSKENIITVTKPDPKLIANARASYRAQRMNMHDISKIESDMDKINEVMKLVDDSIAGWEKDYEVDFDNDKEDGGVGNTNIDKMKANIIEKRNILTEWEWALVAAEEALDSFANGGIISPSEMNAALETLAKVSMMKSDVNLVDMSKINVPGEGCEGMDYISTKDVNNKGDTGKGSAQQGETIEVVGGVDLDALDVASDAPVLLEDAESAYQSLLQLAQSMNEALFGPAGASTHAKLWVHQLIGEELHKKGVDEKLPTIEPITTSVSKPTSSSSSNIDGMYTAKDSVTDIDRLLEIEDADRTGKFDYASIVHGARVLRRGPYGTSYALYETLPLLNRVLAYTKLRFYGHPPEAALTPTYPMHARGQCWSFTNEYSSSRTRRQAAGIENDMIGEYATLTVSLPSAIMVTEVMVEHIPPTITSDPTTAMKEFRVLGFEDDGAFGEPWELGSFVFNIGPSIQAFPIPTMLDGQTVPKLKAISIAVDSNYGADYTCLYRVRIHQ